MTKIILPFILLLFVSLPVVAQTSGVGVNTVNPQGVFHIDARGNTNGGNNVLDDIIVDENGNTSVGKINPNAKLDVAGNVLLTGNDTIHGKTDVAKYVLVNDTLRIGTDTLTNLHSKLEIIAEVPGTGLRFDNGSQNINDKLNDPIVPLEDMIPVLTQENDTLVWRNLEAVTKIKSCPVIISGGRSTTNNGKYTYGVNLYHKDGAGFDVTDGELELEPGDWLICAGLATAFATGAEGNVSIGWYVYLNLRKPDAQGNYVPGATIDGNYENILAYVGTPSEQKGAGVSNPQLVYLLHVPGPANGKYKLFASTSMGKEGAVPYWTTNAFGPAYFYAIKIDN